MADEIPGDGSVNASPDATSVFYLLKIRTRDNLGQRDANGDPVSYFDVEDIGAIQSTALLQDFNNNEFIEIPGNLNLDWINGTANWGGLITENPAASNKGRILIPELDLFGNGTVMVPKFEAEWDIVVANDRVTEINAATAIKDAFNGPNVANSNGTILAGTFDYALGNAPGMLDGPAEAWPFYGVKIKNVLRAALPVFIDVQNHTDLTNILEDIINNTSYLNLPGSDTRFINNAQSSNVIEALNKMYGPNTATQENTINPIDGSIPLVDFATIGDFVRTQVNRTQVPLGPVFSDATFWANFTNTTNKNTLTEGIIQNFLLAQDISGQLSGITFLSLSGTPTGFESGKFLVANETGLEWTDIGDPVLSFTGLTDTPTGFESGKFLVANETGLEWTDIEDPVLSFTGLSDTPTGYDDGKILQSTTTGLAWVDMPVGGGGGGGGGSSTFEDLTDTPSSFIGESGKFVKVNDAEDALEFTTFNVNDALGLQEVDGEDNCSEFHLQSDKAANSSAFEDSSVNNYSILGSNVIHSTSNPRVGFGSSSIQFNGNGQLLVADGSAFKFFHTKIIKNYTIQLWIFKDTLNTREPLLLTAANNNEHGIRLIVDSDNKVKLDVMKGLSNATGLSLASTSTVSAQTWHHVAIVNENNTMSLYLDGNKEQSLAWASEPSTITPNFGLSIGAGPMGVGQAMVFFNGRMQDIRVDKIAFRSGLLPPTSLLNATCDPSAGKSNIDFKMLRDTPVNYSNAGGKYVKVKDGEDGVEFVEISVGSSTTNEFSTAYVTQDQTSDGLITDLEFGNLVVGRTYRISSTICFESNSASALSRADFYNGNKRIVSLYNKGLTSTVSNSMLFIASDNSISVSGNGLTANNFIQGLPELSFVQLELPPSVVVEIEDIPVAPVAPPGGGIFSVNDVKMHAGIIDFQDHSNTFSDIDSNAFGGSIIDIGDVRAISRIDNTSDQKVFEDFDPRLKSIDQLTLADVRMITQIDNTGQVRTFEDFRPDLTSFGVLSFTDMSMRTKIYATGASDPVKTTDPYIAHSITSNSWTGIN